MSTDTPTQSQHSQTPVDENVHSNNSPQESVKSISPLLALVYVIWRLNIPTINPYVSDTQERSQIATGILSC